MSSFVTATKHRFRWLSVFFGVFSILILGQLFRLQVLNYTVYASQAADQHSQDKVLKVMRGDIFWSDKTKVDYPLVTNRDYWTIFAVPSEITDPQQVLTSLDPYFDLNKERLLVRLAQKDDPYEPLVRKVITEKKELVAKLDLKGVYFESEVYRYYPQANLASHVTGFLGFDDQGVPRGQYGLEAFFEDQLRGQSGKLKVEVDSWGRIIGINNRLRKTAVEGVDLYLTIDRSIQYYVCQKLAGYLERFKGDQLSVVIVNPQTGAVLALCSYPDFDPNNYSQTKHLADFANPLVMSSYEPGSIMKPITMAMGIDLGLVDHRSTYLDEGEIKYGQFKVRNSDLKAHGQQTMVDVLNKSLNTGAIHVADLVGSAKFVNYLRELGFGSLTGISLFGEVSGDISQLDDQQEIFTATASYGQGFTVTPLQMVTSFIPVAAHGKLMKPYLVDKMVDSKTNESLSAEGFGSQFVRQVFSPQTSQEVSAMMVSTVQEAYRNSAYLEGYQLAGKTGTAQVSQGVEKGYSDQTIHSFVGFGPVPEAKFLMLIKLNNPKGFKFASTTLTHVFRDFSKFLVEYYDLPPSNL